MGMGMVRPIQSLNEKAVTSSVSYTHLAEQYPIDHADVDAPLPDGLVTEPINIDDYK